MNAAGAMIVKGRWGAGLGDHIVSLLVGLAYARIHGRAMWVDWREGMLAPRGVDAFEPLFRLRSLPACAARPVSDDVVPQAWRGWLNEDSTALWHRDGNEVWDRAEYSRRYSMPLRKDCAAEVVVHVLSDELPMLLDEKFGVRGRRAVDRWLRRLASEELALSPGMDRMVDDAMRLLPRPIAGIHVRMTDKSPAPPDAYVRMAREMLRREPAMNFFIASDNPSVEGVFAGILGSDRVHAAPKWTPDDGTPIHLSERNPDLLGSSREALRDLVMLARCDRLIFNADSSFGLCASLLSAADEDSIREAVPSRTLVERFAGVCERWTGYLRRSP